MQTAQPSGGSLASGSGGAGGSGDGPLDMMDASTVADASVPEIDSSSREPALDPDVKFEWEETLPGQGMCGPNPFTGSFSCTFEDNPLASLAGQVSFELTESREGVFLLMGQLNDQLGLPSLHIDLVGELECAKNGVIAAGQSGVVILGIGNAPSFNAVLKGEYDRQTLEIIGTIELTLATDPPRECAGTFSAGATP